jgi:hypothetical protein
LERRRDRGRGLAHGS